MALDDPSWSTCIMNNPLSLQELSLATAPTEDKVKVLLMFNRTSEVFLQSVGYLPLDAFDAKSREHTIFVEAEMGTYDVVVSNTPGKQPTLSDWKIVPKEEAPQVITEDHLNSKVAYKITERYPVTEQINILARAIKKLAEKYGQELNELEEMLDYIDLVKRTNRAHKEALIESPDVIYKSREDLDAEKAHRYAGGLHELIGPRKIDQGRVFS